MKFLGYVSPILAMGFYHLSRGKVEAQVHLVERCHVKNTPS
jgi:hypothetical protein